MLIANAEPVTIKLASRILAAGGLVAVPTETVYGLAAALSQEEALRRIYRVKRRPDTHPLIVHVADAFQASRLTTDFSETGGKLAEAFWPRSSAVPSCITGGHETVGIRVPQHPVTLELLRELQIPIAAPSANRFTQVSPTRASHVALDLGQELDLILDGGPCEVGVESTVLDISRPQPTILRPGGISREALELVLETEVRELPGEAQHAPSPGRHPLHYSPQAQVQIATSESIWKLAADRAREGKRVRVFSFSPPPGSASSSPTADHWHWPQSLHTIARELYARFRQADRDQIEILLVELPPPEGLGMALADRLRRAAGGTIMDAPESRD
jgi:L-threonylcarbamoyladenylate synthase